MSRRAHFLHSVSVLGVLALFALAGCGGSGSSGSGGGGGGGGNGDFSISVQPSSVAVGPGSSASVNVSITPVSGFNAQVSVTVSGAPTGVTAVPSSFNLTTTGQQTVTFTAGANVAPVAATISVTGTSGSLTHASNLALGVDSPAIAMHPPTRTRYLRTDAQWDYAFINFFPQQWIMYDPGTKRFFANNTILNRIDVFDAATEMQIAQIPVPAPWVSDETSDHSTIYVGTLMGDLYKIDPVGLTVVQRIPSVEIGPTGFQAFEVRVLADGRLVLMGSTGGIPAVDGFSDLGVWNPTDNSVTWLRGISPGLPIICDQLGSIAEMTVNAERTKILISSADSDGTLCLVDPDTATYKDVALGGFLPPAMIPPDGKSILLAGGSAVDIFDAQGIFLTDSFQVGDGSGFYSFALSNDGNTLYAVSGSVGLAYDWRTHAQTGWFTPFTTGDLISSTLPEVADETGLIAGVIGNGVSFVDGGSLLQAAPGLQVPNPSLLPRTGPPSGGTQTTISSDISATRLSQVYFGTGLAEAATVDNLGIHVASPPGNPGPVDVAAIAKDGAYELSPEGFSYGPWFVEATPNAATAEGGGTATIYGYGFGPFGEGQQESGLLVSIGGQPATIAQYYPTMATGALDPYYPFPVQGIVVTVPPGTAGSAVDITVSNSAGSFTAKKAFTYLPATQLFPLTSASLTQGIYDSHRDLYYFTDLTQVRVFSRTQGQWLPSIAIAKASFLWGLALSPDGSKLAVSDAGASLIYLVDPSSPTSVTTFTLPNVGMDQGEQPAALVVTDSGIIYYDSFYLSGTGGWALHKLDTTSGVVTDYQLLQAGAGGSDAYARVLLSSDNARVFVNYEGVPLSIDTASDTVYFNPILDLEGGYEMTLASNGTWMSADDYLADTNLNAESAAAYAEREVWNVLGVYGQKLSPDGNLLFSPLQNDIDVLDGKRGNLLTRISLPVSLSPNYDALVSDGKDNILIAITGATGTGIAVVDLTAIPEPAPLPYAGATGSRRSPFTAGKMRPLMEQERSSHRQLTPAPDRPRLHIKHIVKPPSSFRRAR